VTARTRAGVVLAALAASASPAAPVAASLTEPARLAAIYDLILDARFEAAAAETARACGPAPPVACQLLDVTALWWRMQLDEQSTALDPDFARNVDAAIAAAEAWTEREPDRAEAWFYLGAAYGLRVQWRVLRAERLAAARDGKRIKEALERALELDPSLYDARFGIGLYKYYADVAPAMARFLRFILLLPGGDRDEGMRDMLVARERGALLRGEADYQLHWIDFWYEEKPVRGLAVLEQLRAHYPHNPLFASRLADVRMEYFHDPAASLAVWQDLMAAAQAGRVGEAPLALTRARLGAAERLDELYETDRAVELVSAVIRDRAQAPYGARARAHVLLGAFQDRMGHSTEAVAAYRAALAAVPPRDPADLAARARAGLRQRSDPTQARAYALSLAGWRAYERGALEAAAHMLNRALALRPADPVTMYRRGCVHRARAEPDQALALFGRMIAARSNAPPVFLARAYVERAQLLESSHDHTGALESYRHASRVFGADARTKQLAARAVARLQSPSTPSITPH
jgi:tetratricopeptide (TPR) repeat protein